MAGAGLVQRRNILVLAQGSIVFKLRQERVDDERDDEPLLDDENARDVERDVVEVANDRYGRLRRFDELNKLMEASF